MKYSKCLGVHGSIQGSIYTECTVHGYDYNMYMDNSEGCLTVHVMTERGLYPDHGNGGTECTVHGYDCNMYMDNSKGRLSVHTMS